MVDVEDSHRTEETRQALIAQASHLCEEAEALRGQLDVIPEPILTGRPLASDPSFKEIYALLAVYDEEVYAPVLADVAEDDAANLELPEDADLLAEAAWNTFAMTDIIDRIQAARSRLVDHLVSMPIETWRRPVHVGDQVTDVFGFTYDIVQRDAELLRTAAYRLHESRLSSRDEDA